MRSDQDAAAVLTDAEKSAQEFVYILSHDLSGPLRGITELSRLLKMDQFDVLNEEGQEYLSLIIESGQKMQKMLSALLDYSRVTTTGQPFSHVDCNALLKNCQGTLQDKIGASQGKLEIMPLPAVHADASQLAQVFMILIDNAFKFQAAGAGPHITVSAENKGDAFVFTIRDNGIGIAPQFQKQIFKPFQRLHTNDEYPGIGMGLTMAEKIIARHGGKIWLDSAEGQGAAFSFSLPN